MRYLVHIGTNKTGTSSLQRAFFDNREALAAAGIAYPLTGIETAAHHNVSRALKGVSPDRLGMPADWMQQLHAECQDAEICLLSSENFHTMQDPSRMLALCPQGQTQIIVYIREHAAHLVSWYQQAVQSRNTAMTLEEFIEHHALSFAEMIDKWARAYGDENMIVRLYERSALKKGDVIADFCSFLKPEITKQLTGKAVAGNLLFTKRLLNCFLDKEESLSVANEVAGLIMLDPSFSGKVPTGQETINRIKYLCRADRAELKERYGLKMKARTTPIEGPACPDLATLPQDLERIHDAARTRQFRLAGYLERMLHAIGPVSARLSDSVK